MVSSSPKAHRATSSRTPKSSRPISARIGGKMLSLDSVSVRYGGLAALTDITLNVGAGEFVTVVGPNGAGKTTLFKAISGVVPLAHGKVTFEGQDLARVAASRRPHLGIAHVPENRQV